MFYNIQPPIHPKCLTSIIIHLPVNSSKTWFTNSRTNTNCIYNCKILYVFYWLQVSLYFTFIFLDFCILVFANVGYIFVYLLCVLCLSIIFDFYIFFVILQTYFISLILDYDWLRFGMVMFVIETHMLQNIDNMYLKKVCCDVIKMLILKGETKTWQNIFKMLYFCAFIWYHKDYAYKL